MYVCLSVWVSVNFYHLIFESAQRTFLKLCTIMRNKKLRKMAKFPKTHLFWGKWAILPQFWLKTGILNFWVGSKDLLQNVLYNVTQEKLPSFRIIPQTWSQFWAWNCVLLSLQGLAKLNLCKPRVFGQC